jgi:uncharacterized repeat protein (TIGR01451 family)
MVDLTIACALTHAARRVGRGLLRVLDRATGSARFVVGTRRVHNKALALGLLLLVPAAHAATAFNTPIANTATASFTIGGTPVTSSGTVTTLTAGRTSAVIELLQFVPNSTGGTLEQVNPALCGGARLPAPTYIYPPATALTVPGPLRLAPAEYYSNGDPLFVRVTDLDQNANAANPDMITITVSAPTGDSETLTLTETGNSTGVFIGYVQSTGGPASAGDCALSVASNQSVTANYADPLDTVSSVAAAALVDPYGILFDSATGTPLDGAAVTLVDDASGLPATVYCDDGVTALPQPVTSGAATVCDPAMTTGGYRFPRVVPGSYRLTVAPAAGHAFPSADTTPAGSYTVVGAPSSGASYGVSFPLNPGPAIKIDVPLDPAASGLLIVKTANKASAAIGEFVPYSLAIRNSGTAPAANVQIGDHLPHGFRYQPDSAKLDGAMLANPAITADGSTLTFRVGAIAAGATVTLKYVASISAGARVGEAENTAAAVAPHASNTARASVFVRNDLFRDQAILMGRVIVGSCDDRVDNDEQGLENARVLLQDGRYVQTDREGRWHLDNIRPGTHVVQLDLDSLPEGFEAVACEKSSRFAGRSYSQFVNVRGGSLWRADFHVQKKAPESICLDQKLSSRNGEVTLAQTYPAAALNGSVTFMLPGEARAGNVTLNGQPLETEQHGNMLIARLPARSAGTTDILRVQLGADAAGVTALSRLQLAGMPAQSVAALPLKDASEAAQCAPLKTLVRTAEVPLRAPAQKQLQLVEKLPYDDKWLASAQPGVEWLHPQETFYPALPSIKIAVKHDPKQRVEMTLNGEPVSPLNHDGAQVNGSRTLALTTWRGVDIRDGVNLLTMRVLGADGQLVREEHRTIRHISAPARVGFDEAQSRLTADGKTRPVIAVKFTDKGGYPVRTGVNGEFQINEPYQAWDKQEGIERAPLSGRIGNKPRFEITADGTALIELVPTTQSGEVVLTFQFSNGAPQEIRAWLKPGTRDWVLVGFAEGTLGHKQLSGNRTALDEAAADGKLFDGDRIAFYAKGMIKGDTLMTIAYDTAKRRGDGGSSLRNLKQAIDPNQYYTLYADATDPTFDAASASKLYVKLERNQFYALFGDYDTGLTVTEFGRYSRTLNGLKSEYKGKRMSYNAFATQTAQAFVKDEIRGDGTSGLYRLSRSGIVINSDKIRIETRDRFHSEVVLKTRILSRYLDYDIDHVAGTLFFREPVTGRDEDFNPNTIVAEYESEADADRKLSYGGRLAIWASDSLEAGVTHVHEGNLGASGKLSALDATYQLGDNTRIKAEVATSDRETAGVASDGNAWKVELTHDTSTFTGKAYAREQEGGFGLGQQAGGDTGTRKRGADARLKMSETAQVQGEMYRQDTRLTGAQRDVAEGRLEWRQDALSAHAGLRIAHDEDALGQSLDSRQAIVGAGYEMLDRKLLLRGAAEIDVSGDGGESVDFPDRYKLGADYKLTEQTTLFAEQEFARGEKLSADLTRVGLRTKPWSGGEVAASLGSDLNNDSNRLFSGLGLTQRWQINEFWMMDFGVDRVDTLKNDGVAPLNPDVPLSSGSLTNDYTAVFNGVNYTDRIWSGNARIEWRSGDTDDRINLLAGVQRNLDHGRSIAAGFAYTRNESASGRLDRTLDARLSWAHRPNDSQWVVLDRLDYIQELTEDTASKINARKLVNNLNANWMPNRRTQLAMQYGAKYVFDTIDGRGYDGFTDLIGAEIRRDLGGDWDIGMHGSVLHSWNGDQIDYGLGTSVGYQVFDNAWVSMGYNWLGFKDGDFSGAEYRAQGPFVAFRIKVDQDTLKLNDNKGGFFARMKP